MRRAESGKPELLAPAGDMERLRMAVAYGADAVYLAGASFGMRAFAGNFDEHTIYDATRLCKEAGVRTHVTINTMPRGDEVEQLPRWLEILQDAGVDAVIVADLGAFRLAERYAPALERHISTQASVSNPITARAWYELGAKRVILARELSLEEVSAIRRGTPPGLEIEAFVHGAMCVSYSGRCLLSNYMTGRDASRGACAQPCRYQYYLMEEKRPGEYFPVFEDEKGTYIMNSRDMCMIDHVGELMNIGLDSFKIEGRPSRPTTPPLSPEPTATPSTPPGKAAPWGPFGAPRWTRFPTGTTPPASGTASPASSMRTPATSGTGRSAPSWRTATAAAWPPCPCATNSPPGTRWSWWGRIPSPSPSWPR